MTQQSSIPRITHTRHEPADVNQRHKDNLTLLDKAGVLVTKGVGTMYAAILFTILSLISLPAAIKSHDKIIIISWIAQTFLQLVLLPIIIVGQNIQGKRAEVMADEEFQTTKSTYKDLEHLILVNQKQLELLLKLASGKETGLPKK